MVHPDLSLVIVPSMQRGETGRYIVVARHEADILLCDRQPLFMSLFVRPPLQLRRRSVNVVPIFVPRDLECTTWHVSSGTYISQRP